LNFTTLFLYAALFFKAQSVVHPSFSKEHRLFRCIEFIVVRKGNANRKKSSHKDYEKVPLDTRKKMPQNA